jgi:hypothetical protein
MKDKTITVNGQKYYYIVRWDTVPRTWLTAYTIEHGTYTITLNYSIEDPSVSRSENAFRIERDVLKHMDRMKRRKEIEAGLII